MMNVRTTVLRRILIDEECIVSKDIILQNDGSIGDTQKSLPVRQRRIGRHC